MMTALFAKRTERSRLKQWEWKAGQVFIFIRLRISNYTTQNGDFPLKLSILMNERRVSRIFLSSPPPSLPLLATRGWGNLQ